jgi:hypothetical protein
MRARKARKLRQQRSNAPLLDSPANSLTTMPH